MAQMTRRRVALVRRQQSELLQRLAHRHPERVLSRAREKLGQLTGRLAAAQRFELGQRRRAFGMRVAQLHALSPLAVLGRGYAIALKDELAPGDQVRVRVAHGAFRARVTQVEAPLPVDDAAAVLDEEAPVSEVRS
jgi:exodeoxyribonuclease VII large subunit